MSLDLQKIHRKALPTYKEIQDVALKYFGSIHNNYTQKSDDFSLVTKADLEINLILTKQLTKILPEAGIIGEESKSFDVKEYNWIFDPIDGTNNYYKGIPMWGISISLWHNDTPIYGVIIIPALSDNMYYGFLDGGVYNKNGQKVLMKPKSTHRPMYYTGSKNHGISKFATPSAFNIDLSYRATGSSVFNGYNLIKGNFDFAIIKDMTPWDIGAIFVLSKELGYIHHKIGPRIKVNDIRFTGFAHSMLIAKPDIYNDIKGTVDKIIKEYNQKPITITQAKIKSPLSKKRASKSIK